MVLKLRVAYHEMEGMFSPFICGGKKAEGRGGPEDWKADQGQSIMRESWTASPDPVNSDGEQTRLLPVQ